MSEFNKKKIEDSSNNDSLKEFKDRIIDFGREYTFYEKYNF